MPVRITTKAHPRVRFTGRTARRADLREVAAALGAVEVVAVPSLAPEVQAIATDLFGPQAGPLGKTHP